MLKQKAKASKLSFKSIHPMADFSTSRKSVEVIKQSLLSVYDLFPNGVKLTGNELKVLIILKASAIRNSNIAAIDQTQIATLTQLRQPHVARAIAGLKKKKVLLKTWMEEGYKTYRNIYALSVPQELLEKDAKKQALRKEKAEGLETKAKEIEKQWPEDKKKKKEAQKLLNRANTNKEKVCITCNGRALLDVYIRSENIEKWQWCSCSLGRLGAQETGTSLSEWISLEVVEQYLAKKGLTLETWKK